MQRNYPTPANSPTSLLRRLARDQWVRIHGTPRVTVLTGGGRAIALWEAWTSMAAVTGRLFQTGDIEANIRNAIQYASETPAEAVAVVTTRRDLELWRTGRADRYAAMVDEGRLDVPEASEPSHSGIASSNFDARSAAEAALFDALEATPATRGRFALNQRLALRFGSDAAEVDLLAREDHIAVEVDGYHHFTNPDAYRRDRRKDLALQLHGLVVIRVLADDILRDPRDAVNAVVQTLARREA